jgi:hypothetical protein
MTQHLDAPAVGNATAEAVSAEPTRSPADRFMRRLLRLPIDGPTATAQEAQKAFQTSIMVATVRCLLMYIFFPFVLPAIGVASGVGPWIGLPISVAAIVAISMSIRRFWRADHSKRWHYTVLGTVVIGLMIYQIVVDLTDIFG